MSKRSINPVFTAEDYDMILQKLQFMKEASWRNPKKLKMKESAASGKSISRTDMPVAGHRWITAGSMVPAGTSSSTGGKGCIHRKAARLLSSGYPRKMKNRPLPCGL